MKGYSLRQTQALLRKLLAVAIVLSCASSHFAEEVRVVHIEGAIGPATADHFIRALEEAENDGVELFVIRLDTPGGLVASLRDMIKAILSSEVPVATYVSPNGARAASAGTYLSYASHIAAMAPVTNIGSSTPVSIGGGGGIPIPGMPDNENESEDGNGADETTDDTSAMGAKVINDSVAYLKSLAELRGRNVEWAEETVRSASNLTAAEALEINVIDYIAENLRQLLDTVHGLTIPKVPEKEVTLNTENASVVEVESDWRYEFLKVITDPNVAYMMMMIGMSAILYEFYSPGIGGGGVVGIICLLLAAYSLQMLPVNWAGLALIVVGVGLCVAEAFTPTYGVLGLGGVIAFAAGSLLLFDTDVEAFQVSLGVSLAFAAATGIAIVYLATQGVRNWRRKPVSGADALIGSEGVVLDDFEETGKVWAAGEVWNARSDKPLSKNTKVRVESMDGLTLIVNEES